MTKTILIAEDNHDCRELLTLLMDHLGHRTIAVATGEEAIDLAVTHHPHVIFMDVSLPGISGIDATVAIKANPQTAAIPIVGLSAWGQRGYKEKALKAGMAMYLIKPAPADVIVRAIETANQPHGDGTLQ